MLAAFAALAETGAGDVLVAATGGRRGSAVIGDRVTGMLANAGGTAFPADGLVRDLEGIDGVVARLPEIRRMEEALDARIADGLVVPDGVRELLASDRVRRD